MTDPSDKLKFRKSEITDRQTSELIGLARGLVADGQLNDLEIEYLLKWLAASESSTSNPLLSKVFNKLSDALSDGIVDDDERAELISTLNSLCANDFEVGELLKATTLPLDTPPPKISFIGKRFTFTGTFTYGKRRECEAAVERLGATAGPLNKSTAFLVIGEYATDSWAQSSWGRKIEKAMEMQSKSVDVAIVSEAHWRTFL